MEQPSLTAEAIVAKARKIASPKARTAFLIEVCGNDKVLRKRVAALWNAANGATGQHMPKPAAAAADPGLTTALSEGPGAQIGPYKLLEQIGEGGMGVVYMAEQQAPVRRRVALKIIKPGMDTRQVIARFEAERQALAMMDHPNIAHVLDAGATDIGPALLRHGAGPRRPDHRVLRPEQACPSHERLELFVQVCQAVQHAHQKGIIHRDIKPSNVLVTLHDGRAGAQGDRFRRRQGDQPAADRQDAVHRTSPR